MPCAWQGWVVLAGFALATLACVAWVLPVYGPIGFVMASLVLCVLLTGICWLTGERPAWRWGDDT